MIIKMKDEQRGALNKRFIGFLADKQMSKHCIELSEQKVYRYGYELMAEKLSAILFSIAIAVILHAYTEVLIFYFVFIPLRWYAGGFHVKSVWLCQILSALILLSCVVLSRLIPADSAYIPFIDVAAIFIIYLTSSCDVRNKTIVDSEKRVFKNVLRVICLLQMLMDMMAAVFDKQDYSMVFLISHNILIGLNVLYLMQEKHSNLRQQSIGKEPLHD